MACEPSRRPVGVAWPPELRDFLWHVGICCRRPLCSRKMAAQSCCIIHPRLRACLRACIHVIGAPESMHRVGCMERKYERPIPALLWGVRRAGMVNLRPPESLVGFVRRIIPATSPSHRTGCGRCMCETRQTADAYNTSGVVVVVRTSAPAGVLPFLVPYNQSRACAHLLRHRGRTRVNGGTDIALGSEPTQGLKPTPVSDCLCV